MKRSFFLWMCGAMLPVSAMAAPVELDDGQMAAVVAGTDYAMTKLVANRPGVAAHTDRDLVNPWGLALAPGGRLWVSDNGSGVSTVYDDRTGQKLPLTVSIPAPGGGSGAPTGAVFSDNPSDFIVRGGGKSGHASFLFSTEDGSIAGWSPGVDRTHALTAVNRVRAGANYKGLTIGRFGGMDRLFAADFANNQVDVFDSGFHRLGSFSDLTLPAGYAPFNVQALNGSVYVTFALKEAHGGDDVAGAGHGFVDVFDGAGRFQRRVASNGALNSPWGLTIAPASFGQFAGALLVGNFGDGKINAYNPTTGQFLGELKASNGQPLDVAGLWGLKNGPNGTVLFSAGPDHEQNGLLGSIQQSHVARLMATAHLDGSAAIAAGGRR